MVDGLPVATLVLQEVGIVVVDLGVVGQRFHSRSKVGQAEKGVSQGGCTPVMPCLKCPLAIQAEAPVCELPGHSQTDAWLRAS